MLNGVGAVIEGAVWRKRAHWGKMLLVWVFELVVASWMVKGLLVLKGLWNVQWSSICDVGGESSVMF